MSAYFMLSQVSTGQFNLSGYVMFVRLGLVNLG
jgi:hypothetical protein